MKKPSQPPKRAKLRDAPANWIYESMVERSVNYCLATGLGHRAVADHIRGLCYLETWIQLLLNTVFYSKATISPIVLKDRQMAYEARIANNAAYGKPFYEEILPGYRFSPNIELLFQAITQGRPNSPDQHTPQVDPPIPILRLIQDETILKRYRDDLNLRTAHIRNNQKSTTTYVNQIFKRHDCLIVCRIDFGYTQNQKVSTKSALQDKQRFLNNIRSLGKFKRSLVGYIATIEFDPLKGGYYFNYYMFFSNELALPKFSEIEHAWKKNSDKQLGTCHPRPVLSRNQQSDLFLKIENGSDRKKLLIEEIRLSISRELYFSINPDQSINSKFRKLFRGEIKHNPL